MQRSPTRLRFFLLASLLGAASTLAACGQAAPATDDGGSDAADSEIDAPSCPSGTTSCNGTCTDMQSDNSNCGMCGAGCAPGTACTAGVCKSPCASTQTLCGNACVDAKSDIANCGSCGHACAVAEACSAGSCVLGPFGTGTDGVLTISGGTRTEINTLVTAFTGAAGDSTISATTPTGFATGQLLFLHQSQGAGAGSWEIHRITAVNGTSFTLDRPLEHSYASGSGDVSQALVMPQYKSVQIDSGTLTAPAWDGTSGGILAIAATDGVTIGAGGEITMDEAGYRGHADQSLQSTGQQGESGVGAGTYASTANGNGGGGGGIKTGCTNPGGGSYFTPGGGGGGYGTTGGAGRASNLCGPPATGAGGETAGANDQSTIFFGGAGGSTAGGGATAPMKGGGKGGGIIYIAAPSIAVVGKLSTIGGPGLAGKTYTVGIFTTQITVCQSSSGGGAGGALYLRADTVTLSSDVHAKGGTGALGCGAGGDGGDGRITIRGVTKTPTVVGTTDPIFTVAP